MLIEKEVVLSDHQDEDENLEWLCETCRRAVDRLVQAFPTDIWKLESVNYGACPQGSEEEPKDPDESFVIFAGSNPICLLFFELQDSEGFRIPIFLAGKHPLGEKESFYLQVSEYETDIFRPDNETFLFDLDEVIAILNAFHSRSCFIERLEIGRGWNTLDTTQLVALIDDENGSEKKLRLSLGQFIEGRSTYNPEWEDSLDFVDSAPPVPAKRSLWRRILGR